MARIKGAKNFHIAEVQQNDGTYRAGEVEKAARIISIEIETKSDSEDVYSDDEVEETVYGVVEKSGKIVVNYLTADLREKLFGGKVDNKGVYFPPGETTLKHKAMGFEMPTTAAGKSKYAWYYDVVFEYPNEKGETAESKPKLQEVEIAFKCYKNKELNTHVAELDMNGSKADGETATAWFESVYTKPSEE